MKVSAWFTHLSGLIFHILSSLHACPQMFSPNFTRVCSKITSWNGTQHSLATKQLTITSMPCLAIPNHAISSVIKWTRKEHKEMHSSSTFGCSAWTSGFYLFFPVQSHTLDTLWQMEEALNTFHANTDIFLDKGIHENFDILKLYLIFH